MVVLGWAFLVFAAFGFLALGFLFGELIPWHGSIARTLATAIFLVAFPAFLLALIVDERNAIVISYYAFTAALGWMRRMAIDARERRSKWRSVWARRRGSATI